MGHDEEGWDAMRVWISWYQPTDDYRPLTDPPADGILGWWCSGYDQDDVPSICALVDVDSSDPESAKKVILHSWPEADRWRFCDPREDDYLPGDRFPLKPWMEDRVASSAQLRLDAKRDGAPQ